MKEFEIKIPLKYHPVLKKLAKELGISMKKFLEVILVLYIKEFYEDYFDDVMDESKLRD